MQEQERRVHRRTQVQRQVAIRPLAESRRSEWMRAVGLGPPPRSTTSTTAASGRLIDIGQGGMCSLVDQTMEVGRPCLIDIVGIEGKAQRTRGEIGSFRRGNEGNLVGIVFDEPLVALGDTARRGPKLVDDRAIKPLVLVVDDEPTIRTILDRFLSQRGLRVFPAVDADAALQAIKHERPSVMMLDLKLPKVTGLQLLQLLKQIGLEVPNIWAMSGYVSDQDARLAMQLGASEFINKPFDLDHIDYMLGLLPPETSGSMY